MFAPGTGAVVDFFLDPVARATRGYGKEQLAIPALGPVRGQVVGRGAVAGRISLELVPTLV